MVNAHLVFNAGAVTQLIGWMMISIVYMYHKGNFVISIYA